MHFFKYIYIVGSNIRQNQFKIYISLMSIFNFNLFNLVCNLMYILLKKLRKSVIFWGKFLLELRDFYSHSHFILCPTRDQFRFCSCRLIHIIGRTLANCLFPSPGNMHVQLFQPLPPDLQWT